jgi:hypothetical protein
MQSIVIDAPEVQPLPFGLTSVANLAEVGADGHILAGFEYETQCGHVAGFSVNPCTGLTGSTSGGTAPTLPASLTIGSDVPGTYTITWGNGTPSSETVTIAQGETAKTVTHTFTTTGNKTVTVAGPLGFGTRTIVLNPGTTNSAYAGAAFSKPPIPSLTTVIGDPVTLLSRYECTAVGADQATRDARAMEGLNRSDSWSLEKALYTRVLSDPGVVDLTGGTGTTANRAIALLENYAAVYYSGIPTIHVDRFTGSLLGNGGVIARHGNHLETVQGSLVASGAGYSVHPVPASGWAWVTGQVVIRRGTARTIPGFDQTTNAATVLAERTAVFAVECIVAKAQIATA